MPPEDGHCHQDNHGSGNRGRPVLAHSPTHERITSETSGKTAEKCGGNVSRRSREKNSLTAGEETCPQTIHKNRQKVHFPSLCSLHDDGIGECNGNRQGQKQKRGVCDPL